MSGLVFAWFYFQTGRNLWAMIVAYGVMNSAGMILICLGVYPGI